MHLRQIDNSLLCPEGTYVYLNCTVGHRVIIWYDVCLNESEVNCWVRTAGSVICCTSRPVIETGVTVEKGFMGPWFISSTCSSALVMALGPW